MTLALSQFGVVIKICRGVQSDETPKRKSGQHFVKQEFHTAVKVCMKLE